MAGRFFLLAPIAQPVWGLSVEIVTHKADKSGRLISAKLKHNNPKFQILNVYAPVSDRKAFFDTFWQYTFRNVPLIVGGSLCTLCTEGQVWR